MFFDGYDEIFAEGAKTKRKGYSCFRSDPVFGFAVATAEQRLTVDHEALGKALEINPYLASALFTLGKPMLGYHEIHEEYRPCDVVDSRHIMMITQLVTRLPEHPNKVIEIGGGFGNWLRMIDALNIWPVNPPWTFVDLEYVLDLQRWFIGKCNLKNRPITEVSFFTPEMALQQPPDYDLMIATHSLSEVSWDTFNRYAEYYFPHIKYLYYSMHLHQPSSEMSLMKQRDLETVWNFVPLDELFSEHGQVRNCLYVRGDVA